MKTLLKLGLLILGLCGGGFSGQAALLKALIVDGQNNHDWKSTTPLLKNVLEQTGIFEVDVATSPGKGQDMSGVQQLGGGPLRNGEHLTQIG